MVPSVSQVICLVHVLLVKYMYVVVQNTPSCSTCNVEYMYYVVGRSNNPLNFLERLHVES